jgi:hypothetical protein
VSVRLPALRQRGADSAIKPASRATKTVTVSTSDNAGNTVSKQLTITVVAPGTAGGGTTVSPPSNSQIGQQGGGRGGTQTLTITGAHGGAFSLVVPTRLSLHLAHRGLLLDLTAPAAGSVELTLMKGSRRLARGKLAFGGPGSSGFKMILPASLKPGHYRLKIKFTPRTGKDAATRTITITAVK